MNCESCIYYVYDEEYDYFSCEQDLDEDEMMKFVKGMFRECPYYRCNDDYRIVRHQM
ncbi:DUF6472 family protein [Lachnospiraceae bacterium LCP25S3_G4]